MKRNDRVCRSFRDRVCEFESHVLDDLIAELGTF